VAVLTESLDAEVVRNGWTLAASVNDLLAVSVEDVLLIGAVPWSSWDRHLLRHVASIPSEQTWGRVAVFNFDDIDATRLSVLLGGRPWSAYQPPLVAHLHDGAVQQLEQGWRAVEWAKNFGADR
jgi:hypothetical protein